MHWVLQPWLPNNNWCTGTFGITDKIVIAKNKKNKADFPERVGGFVNHLCIMCPNLDCPIITDEPTGELGPIGAVAITDKIVVGTNKADALHT